jgi:hypothetical protein
MEKGDFTDRDLTNKLIIITIGNTRKEMESGK